MGITRFFFKCLCVCTCAWMSLCEYRPMHYRVFMGVRGQPQLSIPPFVLPHSRAEGWSSFVCMLGIWTQALTLTWQALYPLSHFSGPKVSFNETLWHCLYLFPSHLASTVKGQNLLQAMSGKTSPNSPMMKFKPMTFGFKQRFYSVPSTLCGLTIRPCNSLIGLMEASLMASRKKMKIKKKKVGCHLSYHWAMVHWRPMLGPQIFLQVLTPRF